MWYLCFFQTQITKIDGSIASGWIVGIGLEALATESLIIDIELATQPFDGRGKPLYVFVKCFTKFLKVKCFTTFFTKDFIINKITFKFDQILQ